jgi:hypothetical protein
MIYQNTLIKPDGYVSVEFSNDRPYFHSEFFNIKGGELEVCKDWPLSDGSYIHTKTDNLGRQYILILQKHIQ